MQFIDASNSSTRDQVLAAIAHSAGGMTDDELFHVFVDFNQNSIRPRRVELLQEGKIYDSGQKRFTSSGNLAVVWKAS